MSTKSTRRSSIDLSIEEKFQQAFGANYRSHANSWEFNNQKQSSLCDHIVIAQNAQDIINAASLAYEHLLPFEIVGTFGLSLLSPFGYSGLLIINQSKIIVFDPASSLVLVESGVLLDDLINQAASQSLGSLEVFSGVVSSIGGAIVTNLTSGKVSFFDYLRELTLLKWDSKKQVVTTLKSGDLPARQYWTSLMEIKEPYAILTAKIQLAHLPQEVIINRIAQNRIWRESRKNIAVAYPFDSPLETEKLKLLNQRLLKNHDFQLDKDNPNLVISRNYHFDQMKLKFFLDNIKTSLSENGIIVKNRLKLIGSWTENEKNNTTDTQGF